MTMADWAFKLDAFLQFNDAEILLDKGRVTAAIAKAYTSSVNTISSARFRMLFMRQPHSI